MPGQFTAAVPENTAPHALHLSEYMITGVSVGELVTALCENTAHENTAL